MAPFTVCLIFSLLRFSSAGPQESPEADTANRLRNISSGTRRPRVLLSRFLIKNKKDQLFAGTSNSRLRSFSQRRSGSRSSTTARPAVSTRLPTAQPVSVAFSRNIEETAHDVRKRTKVVNATSAGPDVSRCQDGIEDLCARSALGSSPDPAIQVSLTRTNGTKVVRELTNNGTIRRLNRTAETSRDGQIVEVATAILEETTVQDDQTITGTNTTASTVNVDVQGGDDRLKLGVDANFSASDIDINRVTRLRQATVNVNSTNTPNATEGVRSVQDRKRGTVDSADLSTTSTDLTTEFEG